MSTAKKINPILSMTLELGPIVAFFLTFGRIKDKTFTILGTEYTGFVVASASLVVLICLCTAILYRLTGHLSRMQILSLVLVIIMGGMTVALNDERFIKMKPTLFYAVFAAILGFGLFRGQSYLRLVMDEVLPMQAEGWMILTRRLTGFFAVMAVANEAVWRLMSTEAWVNFKTFFLTLAMMGFFLAQARLFTRFAIPEVPAGDKPD
jgi:intracellular septation protein